MTMNEMRKYVSDSYPGEKWKLKVSRMPTNQVIAIYKSITSRAPYKDAAKKVPAEKEPHQIDIFEYMRSIDGKETYNTRYSYPNSCVIN